MACTLVAVGREGCVGLGHSLRHVGSCVIGLWYMRLLRLLYGMRKSGGKFFEASYYFFCEWKLWIGGRAYVINLLSCPFRRSP